MDKVLCLAGPGNVNNIDSNNIIFTVKATKLYVPVVTLSARESKTIKTSSQRIWKISLLEWI